MLNGFPVRRDIAMLNGKSNPRPKRPTLARVRPPTYLDYLLPPDTSQCG